jgi:hypothetical protein
VRTKPFTKTNEYTKDRNTDCRNRCHHLSQLQFVENSRTPSAIQAWPIKSSKAEEEEEEDDEEEEEEEEDDDDDNE